MPAIAETIPQFFVRTHSGAQWIALPFVAERFEPTNTDARWMYYSELEQHYMAWRSLLQGTRERHDFPETQSFELLMTRLALTAVHPWLSKDPHAWPDMTQLVASMNYVNGQVQAMIAAMAVRPDRSCEWRARLVVVLGGFHNQLAQADAGVRRVFGLPAVDYRRLYPEC
jgi:hypothetical protein